MFQAASATFNKLKWKPGKKPAKLRLLEDKGLYKHTSREDRETFEQRVKAAEVAKANQKAASSAQKVVEDIINTFVANDANGGILHAKTAVYQAKLRARVSRSQKFGTPWVDIEKDIRNKVNELYVAQDKGFERVGFIEDKMGEVEI